MDEKKRQRRKDRILFNCFVYGILAVTFALGFIVGFFIAKGVYEREQVIPEDTSPNVEYLDAVPVQATPSTPIEEIETVSSETEELNWMEAIATAYCSCEKCCGYWATVRPTDANGNSIVYGATGIVLEQGVSIAADTDIYPIGTVIEIENVGTCIVQDRGGAIKGQHVDVYFTSHEAALQFGKQEVRIRVVE